jgi:hypothetical protein
LKECEKLERWSTRYARGSEGRNTSVSKVRRNGEIDIKKMMKK